MQQHTSASDRMETPFKSGVSQTAARTRQKSQTTSGKPVRIEDLRKAVTSLEEDPIKSTFGQFRQEIARIRAFRRNDRIVLLFLWMLDSVGTYMALNQEKAHPGARSLLRSLYNALEPLILNAEMPEEEKGKVLLDQVKDYRALRTRINIEKDESEPEMTPEPRLPLTGALGSETSFPEEAAAGALPRDDAEETNKRGGQAGDRITPKTSRSPHESFMLTLEEVKKSIRTEFKALRKELEHWRAP